MIADYIVVGQGICGTFLSWNLMREGQRVVVIDHADPFSSSKVASGVINPVTGRRIVKTWMIDALLPFVQEQYELFGAEIGASLIRQCNVLDFHPTPQVAASFADRHREDPAYLAYGDAAQYGSLFNFHYGIGEVSPCLLVQLNTLLDKWRLVLSARECLRNTQFDIGHLETDNDSARYQDITAKKIIFCGGAADFDLALFDRLPYAKNKGEAIIAEIPGLPATNIYKQGISIVPWENDLFWIGSSYEWEYNDLEPSERFRTRVEQQLNAWLKLPYRVVDHIASVRPATVERRPFVGLHPLHSTVGILNGMGTKGCSLAPWFAHQLAQHLVYDRPVAAEADVKRFRQVLGRVID
ncbi:MAG: dependent oxidoreductase [Chitinophagaceae bacterium]|jgi:glycine/D-amino acid oxidase-like deaminating enzyme|nr:dependent oxidoreductase [Chitinophagaceae bacterium]